MRVCYSSKFRRAYKKLPLPLFRDNPFNPVLETHKLHGKHKGYWAFSVSRTHRIMFAFEKKDQVTFINVGDHKVYK